MDKETGPYSLPPLTEARLKLLRGFNFLNKFGRKYSEKNSDVYTRIFLHTFERIPPSILPSIAHLDEVDSHTDLEQRVKEIREQLEKCGARRTAPVVKETRFSRAEIDLIDSEALNNLINTIKR